MLMLLASVAFYSNKVTAQSGSPDLRGRYLGTIAQELKNCSEPAANITFPPFDWVAEITDQSGDSFNANLPFFNTELSGNFTFSGTVTANGGITGTWVQILQLDGQTFEIRGTLTGEASGNNITILFTARLGEESFFCDLLVSFTGARVASNIRSDLRITSSAKPDSVASGDRLTYTIIVTNAGPDLANAVAVTNPLPDNTTFFAASTSQGLIRAPAAGGRGAVTASLGTLANGGTATITVTVNVLAATGIDLSSTASVVSASGDPNTANNSATATNPVEGGGVVQLVWEQTPPTAGDDTPPPQNLRAVVPGLVPASSVKLNSTVTAQTTCTITGYNIYISSSQPVQTVAANLWRTVPAQPLQATVPVAPAGSFYVMTTIWNCEGTAVESRPSNQTGVPQGSNIEKVKASSKLKVTGSGFTRDVEVFLDGAPFKKKAKLSGNQITQKGSLLDGRSIKDVLTEGRTVLITVRNSDGGIGSFSYRQE